MPSVMVVMMVVMVDAPASHQRSGCSALAPLGYPLAPNGSLGPHCVRRVRHCDSGYCDCGERRDEFELVHGVVPFFAGCYVFLLDGSADKPANQSAEERCPYLAPVLRVERAIAVVVMAMLRLVMPHVTGRRRRVAVGDLVPRLMFCRCCAVRVTVRGSFRRLMHWCFRHLPRRGWLRRCGFRSLCLHYRRRFSTFRRIAFRSRHCSAAKCAADRECQHHLLYCLVHCRVPFVVSRKPILALTHS